MIGGHLYVAGGRDANNVVINTLWDYNIASDTWTAGANMLASDNVPGAGVIGGKLFIFGGGSPFTSDNPNDKRAFPIKSKTGSGVSRRHRRLGRTCRLSQGQGQGQAKAKAKGRPNSPRTTNQTQYYDPGTNTWTNGNALLQQRSFPSGTNVGSTYLVAVGGYTGVSTTTSVEVAVAPGGACVSPTPTRTGTPPTATPTACISNYTITSSTGATCAGTTFVAGSNCDDCSNPITLAVPLLGVRAELQHGQRRLQRQLAVPLHGRYLHQHVSAIRTSQLRYPPSLGRSAR